MQGRSRNNTIKHHSPRWLYIRSTFHNLSIFKHKYLICMYDCGKSMCHNDCCSVFTNLGKRCLDVAFSLCIQSRCCLQEQIMPMNRKLRTKLFRNLNFTNVVIDISEILKGNLGPITAAQHLANASQKYPRYKIWFAQTQVIK